MRIRTLGDGLQVSALGVGFVPYSRLGRGFLTGTIAHRPDLAEGDYADARPLGDGHRHREQDAVRARDGCPLPNVARSTSGATSLVIAADDHADQTGGRIAECAGSRASAICTPLPDAA